MISTRNVNADEGEKPRHLTVVTTKKIDASTPAIPKKDWKKNKNPMVTTHNVDALEAAEDKKKRAVVLGQKNAHQKKLDAQLRMAKAREAKGKK